MPAGGGSNGGTGSVDGGTGSVDGSGGGFVDAGGGGAFLDAGVTPMRCDSDASCPSGTHCDRTTRTCVAGEPPSP